MVRRRHRTAEGFGEPVDAGHRASGERVAVVVANPADAAALLDWVSPSATVTVVCLEAGTAAERESFERARSLVAGSRAASVAPPVVAAAGDDGVAERLLRILDEFRPDRVITQDPDPEHTAVDRERKSLVVTEPALRGTAALAAVRAARTHQHRTGRPVFVECLRAAADPAHGRDAALRYPAPDRWLSSDRNGRLSVHLMSAAGVLRWTEGAAEGAPWAGPELLETPPMMPALTVLRGDDGYVRLFGLRRDESRGEGELEVVTAVQYQAGRPLGPWNSLGNPNAGDGQKARKIGFPVACLDASGTLHVFVRNVGRSISTTRQDPAGRWTPWQHLGGARVADEMVAFPHWAGGVDLVARARDGHAAVHWRFDPAAGSWTEDRSVPVAMVPGSLSAAPESGAIRFRHAQSGEVCVWQPGTPGPVSVGGADGYGPVAGTAGADIQGWGCTVLAYRGHDGVCRVGAHPDGRPDAGVWWEPTGDPSRPAPTMAFDRQGRVVIATSSEGGALRITRQLRDSGGLSFEPWFRV